MNNRVSITEPKNTNHGKWITTATSLIERLALWSFTFYVISLYAFAEQSNTLFISQICFILFGVFALLLIISKKKLLIGNYFIYIGIFIFYSTTSYFWSIDPQFTVDKIFTLFQIFIFCILTYHVFYMTGRIDWCISSLLIAGIIYCIIVVHTYTPQGIYQSLLASSRLGNSSSVDGNVFNTNSISQYASTSFVICIFYALSKKNKMYYLVSMIPFILTMATGTRKGVIIIAIGILMAIYAKTGKKNIIVYFFSTIIILLVGFKILQMPIFSGIYSRFERLINGITGTGITEKSADTRQQMIKFGWEQFKKRLLFGYGTGSSSALWLSSSGVKTYLHCNYIEMLVNGGLIGFTFFYSSYVYIIKNLIKKLDLEIYLLLFLLCSQLITDIAGVSYYSKTTYLYLTIGFVAVRKLYDSSKIN